jgi:hypothetical protein
MDALEFETHDVILGERSSTRIDYTPEAQEAKSASGIGNRSGWNRVQSTAKSLASAEIATAASICYCGRDRAAAQWEASRIVSLLVSNQRGGPSRMKRCLLALGALLSLAVVPALADYVIIKVNLAAARERETQAGQQPQQPGLPGAGARQGGMMGAGAGGKFGAQGGMGAGAGAGFMGGQGGAAGRGGFQAPGGVPGAPGMMRGGGMGGFQGGPAGMQNMMQQQSQRMQQTMRGGQFGMGNPMMGMQPGPFGEEDESDPIHVRAIVEVEKNDLHTKGRAYDPHVWIKHKWGVTHLAYPSADMTYTISSFDTVAKRFAKKKAEIKEDDPDRVDKLLELARWALEHDLIGSALPPANADARPPSPVDQVSEIMAELARIDAKNSIVVAFAAAQKRIQRQPDADNPAAAWKEKVDFKEKSSDHYTLLYDKNSTADVDHVLTRLEHNYKGFYYWFALRGQVLNVPRHRLLAFLVADKSVFDNQPSTVVFDNPAIVEEGLFAPRDNLAVFSSTRLDEAFQALQKLVEQQWNNGWPESVLARGRAKLKLGMDPDPDKPARAETLELVYQAMKEEALLAAVSYEGTRQLITASGLLPQGVEAPQWIDFGLASFLNTPRGAYWPGIGGPNMQNLATIQLWAKRKDKNLEPNALEALQAVVTDRYFQEVKEAKAKETKEEAKAREGQLKRARVMAWALTFFLAQKHPDGLMRYYEELANMPRDLRFDRDVLLGAFGRAFGLTEAGNPAALDKAKADVFARKWYAYVKSALIEVDSYYREYEQSEKKEEKPGKGTGDKSTDSEVIP